MNHTATDPNHGTRDELARIVAWRLAQLRRHGFDAEDAALLAAQTEIDLHEAIRLVEHGCPPKTATQILL